MNCKNCKKQGCSLAGKNHEMSFECKAYIGKTNADRIRAMSDEELAKEVLCGERWFDEKEALKWLKSPVEEVAKRT